MDLKNIRMVVTDMDGTLLNSDHEVSTRFFELFEALDARGIHFVAASGRQYQSIVDKLSAIKNRITIIAENGGFAMRRDEELVSTPLPSPIRNSILTTLEDVPDTYPVLCGKHNAFIRSDSGDFINKLREYYTDFKMIDDLKTHEGEIMKIAVYHFESSEKYIYPNVRQFEGDLKVKVSGENWVDLSHKDAHKGHALQIIQDLYGVGRNETLVFGDYNNDLEMLALADYSVAMANAHPNVLQAAKYKTLSNEEQGVEHILEKMLRQFD